MSKLFLAAGLALATIALVPAAASMPVGIRIILVSPDPHDEALNRGFVAVLEEYHAFVDAGHPVLFADFSRCAALASAAREACVRAELKPNPADRDNPPVVVIATREGGSRYRWQCIGVGERPWAASKQSVRLDLKRALLAKPGLRFAARRTAVDCIMAAASEAEGRVRVERDKL